MIPKLLYKLFKIKHSCDKYSDMLDCEWINYYQAVLYFKCKICNKEYKCGLDLFK